MKHSLLGLGQGGVWLEGGFFY